MKARTRSNAICTDPKWQGRADCQHCGIRHMMLFSGLGESDFDDLLKPIDNLLYSSDCMLYGQEDEGNCVYSIRSGYIKLEQLQLDGSVRIVRLLGRGATVGLEVLLDKRYRHSAVALTELSVCRIHHNTIVQLEEKHPELKEKLMQHWDQHLTFADRWISEISSGPVRDRILELCCYLAELNGGKDKPIRFFGYEDMAAMIGVTRETFSRSVAELKKEGILEPADVSREFIFHSS